MIKNHDKPWEYQVNMLKIIRTVDIEQHYYAWVLHGESGKVLGTYKPPHLYF